MQHKVPAGADLQPAAVIHMLDSMGIDYFADGGDYVMLLSHRGYKWKAVLCCGVPGVITCYCVYPFYIDNVLKLRAMIDNLNERARLGCFILREEQRQMIYRYGAPLLDEFSFEDYARHVLLTSAAVVCEYWEAIYRASNDKRPTLQGRAIKLKDKR